MKTLSLALLLVASLAFVMMGCLDNSNSPISPNDQSASQGHTQGLAKGGPVVHKASGNCGVFFEGKNATFAFTALKYADGSCSGEYQIYVHSQDPDWGKWHGKIMSLEVHDGNKAVIGGVETKSGFPGYYDAFVVVDNGEGKTGTVDMYTTTVFWNESLPYAQKVWAMKPADVVNEIVFQCAHSVPPYIVTPEEILIPIQHGNIQVR